MKRIPIIHRLLPYSFYNVTIILVVLNVAIFLLRYLAVNFHNSVIGYLILIPDDFIKLQSPWAVITYMFIHADPFHLIFNMIALLLFGLVIEHRLGSSEFLLYYFVTGALTGLMLAFIHPFLGWGEIPVVGASGAIYGLMLAYATFYPLSRILIWGLIPVRAYVLVLGLVIFSTIASIFNFMGNVSHLGHLGGIIFGFLYFLIRLRINPVKEIISARRYYQ